jgi:hypothetical protein
VAAAVAAEQGGNSGCCSDESGHGHDHHNDQSLAARK